MKPPSVLVSVGCGVLLLAAIATPVLTQGRRTTSTANRAPQPPADPNAARPWTASDFGLPENNQISSTFDQWRVYRDQRFVRDVPPLYVPNAGEVKRQHRALDVQSRDAAGNVAPLDFTTPVAGKVTVAGGKYNTVKITTRNGGEVRFLLASEVNRELDGQQVDAGTRLGHTGSKRASATHLHVEARNPQGVYVGNGNWQAELGLVDSVSYQSRERNVANIEAELRAKGALRSPSSRSTGGAGPPPAGPGGILLDRQVEMLSDLADVRGAFFDAATNRLVLIGERSVDVPGLDRGLFAVALRAAYAGVSPGVSIDPSDEASSMSVRYIGPVSRTRFGAVMFEADRVLKSLSRGTDNISNEAVRSTVPGYASIVDRRTVGDDARKAGASLYRLWFKPDRLTAKKTDDGRTLAFTASTMVCDWERMEGIDPGPAVAEFVKHLNDNFDNYAVEQASFREMLQLERLVGLAMWMRENNLFLDPARVGFDEYDTPLKTPATTISRTIDTSGTIWTLTSIGGVDLDARISFSRDDGEAAGVREAAIRARPRINMVSWDFKSGSRDLLAVALPVVTRTTPSRERSRFVQTRRNRPGLAGSPKRTGRFSPLTAVQIGNAPLPPASCLLRQRLAFRRHGCLRRT
jgi:hypothetical protein